MQPRKKQLILVLAVTMIAFTRTGITQEVPQAPIPPPPAPSAVPPPPSSSYPSLPVASPENQPYSQTPVERFLYDDDGQAAFVAAQNAVFGHAHYDPRSAELKAPLELGSQGKFTEAYETLRRTFPNEAIPQLVGGKASRPNSDLNVPGDASGNPNELLSPRYYVLWARLAEKTGRQPEAKAVQMLAARCIQGLLSTGDGAIERPILVTRFTDEDDLVVLHFKSRVATRERVRRGSHVLDLVTCKDGGELYFDVTTPSRNRRARDAVSAKMAEIQAMRKVERTKSVRLRQLDLEVPERWKAVEPAGGVIWYDGSAVELGDGNRQGLTFEISPVPGEANPATLRIGFAPKLNDGVRFPIVQLWKPRFADERGYQTEPTMSEIRTGGGEAVTRFETAGDDRSFARAPGYVVFRRLLGGVVEVEGGQYFLELIGPPRTVESATPAFDAMLRGVKRTVPR